MKIRKQRALERTGLVVFLTSGLASLGWAALWPVPNLGPQLSTDQASGSSVIGSNPAVPDIESAHPWSQRLNERRLQAWPVTPPAEELNEIAPPLALSAVAAPLAGLRLTGTIIEPGKSFAILSDPSGAMDLKPVGGLLILEPAGVRVDSIEASRVIVSFKGSNHQLDLTHPAVVPAVGSILEVDAATPSMVELEVSDSSALEMQSDTTPVDRQHSELTPLEAELDWLNGSESGAGAGDPTNIPAMTSQPGAGP
jgi:hypothetical protein